MRRIRSRVWLALLGAGLGCASAQAPPGGEPDRSPPFVIEAEPAPMSVHPDGFDDNVEIRFNERISEKMGQIRSIEDAVLVSPKTGHVKIHRGRSSLTIHEDGGWKPGYVYHIYVRPVIQDLFGNKLERPIDLVFSTGPPIQNTTLGGIVENRIDGKPVPDAIIDATQRGTGATYVTVSDTTGFFDLRYVPAGAYDVVAYQDRNSNKKLDFPEPVDTAVAALAVNDTSIITLPLLPGDTTPAHLVRAEAKDSVTVTLSFDDYLDPDRPVDGTVEFFLLPDSTPAGGGEMMHPFQLEERRAAAKAAADSAASAARADSLAKAAADSAQRAGADTTKVRTPVRVGPDTLPGRLLAQGAQRPRGPQDTAARDTAAPDTAAPPLPSRDVAVVPAQPLLPDTAYVVVVTGVTNINNLPGGGGSARFRTPTPPPPDSARADSLAGADSLGKTLPKSVPPNAIRRDTTPRDTTPRDTTPHAGIPPGTASPPWLIRVLRGGPRP